MTYTAETLREKGWFSGTEEVFWHNIELNHTWLSFDQAVRIQKQLDEQGAPR